jgi:salicylate hydroxylase
MQDAHVVVVGGGIGGLALAIALTNDGISVEVHEQARQFATVGDAINLTPNAVRALDHLGVGQRLRPLAYRPALRINREWDTGEATSTIPLGDDLEATYGTPLMMLRRSDLVDALVAALPDGVVRLGAQALDVDQAGGSATVAFADETRSTGDLVVGADGIHSTLRDRVFEVQPPQYTGIVGYRTLVATDEVRGQVDDRDLASFVKWWGPDRTSQIVTYPTGSGDEFFVFATHADPDWRQESWSAEGDPDAMRGRLRRLAPGCAGPAGAGRQGAQDGTARPRIARHLDRWSRRAAR